jgi:hypothetical protein
MTTKEKIDQEAREAIASGLNESDANIAAALVRGSRATFANCKRWPDISTYPKHIRDYVTKTRQVRH